MIKLLLTLLLINTSLLARINEDLIQSEVFIYNDDPSSFLTKLDDDFSPKEQLTSLQIHKDIDYYLNALQESYSGRYLGNPEDFHNLTTQIRQLKNDPSIISSESLCRGIGSAINSIRDLHSSIFIRLPDHKWRSCVPKLESKPLIGENVALSGPKPWTVRIISTLSGKRILLIGIRDFLSYETDPTWQEMFLAVKQELSNVDHVLLDLRQNRGGGTYAGENLARIMYGLPVYSPSANELEFPTPRPGASWLQTDTPTALVVRSNFMVFDMLNTRDVLRRPIPLEDIEMYHKMLRDFENSLASPGPASSKIHKAKVPFSRNSNFPGRTLILIDGGCASSCEMSLDYFEFLPRSFTMGLNSMGAIHITWAGRLRLPESHLQAKIPTALYLYDDGRNLEKIGHTPSIMLRPGDDGIEKGLLWFDSNPE